MLLKRGADANARPNFGDTALLHAVQGRREQGVRVLLDHGVDVNTVESN